MKYVFVVLATLALAPIVSAKGLKEGSPAELKADFALICNATARSGAAKEKDPGAKAKLVADYLLANLKTKQAMRVMGNMASELPANRSAILKSAAAKAGYKGACLFADER